MQQSIVQFDENITVTKSVKRGTDPEQISFGRFSSLVFNIELCCCHLFERTNTIIMDVLFPYSESKLKPFLKMATQRISISNNKRGTASKKHKREIAKLLEDGKLEKAIIRVEHVIRDDYTMESYEIIELMCDLLYERAKHLTKSELCPPDLVEAVSTVIWASSRVDISELEGARKQLQKKYGREFVELCDENSHGTVNSRVMHKLNVAPPGNLLIRSYLQEIAKEFCVAW